MSDISNQKFAANPFEDTDRVSVKSKGLENGEIHVHAIDTESELEIHLHYVNCDRMNIFLTTPTDEVSVSADSIPFDVDEHDPEVTIFAITEGYPYSALTGKTLLVMLRAVTDALEKELIKAKAAANVRILRWRGRSGAGDA